jgi:hypothetical protein
LNVPYFIIHFSFSFPYSSIATRFKLKTKSYGKDEDRHLVVFKRRDMWQTVEQLLRSGGSTERYDLIKPTGPGPQ